MRLSNIVERLPMYRFLNESHAILLKLEPTWHTWLKKNLPALKTSAAHLSSFDLRSEATLTICTDSATTAAQLKHRKESLIEALNSNALTVSIKRIKIRVDPATANKLDLHHQKLTRHEIDDTRHEQPSAHAIDSIESLQKRIKNPDLADSLSNLAETLKKLSK